MLISGLVQLLTLQLDVVLRSGPAQRRWGVTEEIAWKSLPPSSVPPSTLLPGCHATSCSPLRELLSCHHAHYGPKGVPQQSFPHLSCGCCVLCPRNKRLREDLVHLCSQVSPLDTEGKDLFCLLSLREDT